MRIDYCEPKYYAENTRIEIRITDPFEAMYLAQVIMPHVTDEIVKGKPTFAEELLHMANELIKLSRTLERDLKDIKAKKKEAEHDAVGD